MTVRRREGDRTPRNPANSLEIRTARKALVVAAIVIFLWLCVQLQVIIVDLIVAVTLASAISPVANYGEKKNIPRAATVLVTYILVGCFYAVAASLLWPAIKEQSLLLIQNFPGYLDAVTGFYSQQMQGFGFNGNLSISQADLQNFGRVALNRTLDLSTGAFGVLLNVILSLFLAAYFVVNAKRLLAEILPWVPLQYRDRAATLIGPVSNRMGGYVRGQLLVSTAVAAFFAAGLSLIGVKYALVLGLVAGILNLVPFVGSLIVTSLAVIIAFNQSLLTAGLTLGLFVVEQAVESNFIVPYLLGSQVELDPIVVLIAILIGATLGGAIGALIAVPLIAALLLLADELYLKPMHKEEKAAGAAL